MASSAAFPAPAASAGGGASASASASAPASTALTPADPVGPSRLKGIDDPPLRLRFVSAQQAASIDARLFSTDPAGGGGGFMVEQLMELAGLACAQTVYRCYPPDQFPAVLVAAGPGNQGGDGLVAARHLHHFGYEVSVWYPKQGKTDLFARLKQQCNSLKLPFIPSDSFEDAFQTTDVLLDCIFGFSFNSAGAIREPYREAIELIKNDSIVEFEFRRKRPPIVSIDVPSGWDVDKGNVDNGFTPQVLLSLSAPKQGVKEFTGRHYLGGRFIPYELERELDLFLPAYEGDAQIVDITGAQPLSDEDIRTLRAERDAEEEQRRREPASASGVAAMQTDDEPEQAHAQDAAQHQAEEDAKAGAIRVPPGDSSGTRPPPAG